MLQNKAIVCRESNGIVCEKGILYVRNHSIVCRKVRVKYVKMFSAKDDVDQLKLN